MDELINPIIVNIEDPSKPSQEKMNYDIMFNNRKLFFVADVDSDIVEYSKSIIRWNMIDKGIPAEERTPIWLIILSYGGDLDAMWSFIDIINTSVTPVYTVNLGICASAASLIFISGKQRFMMPHSKVIIHEGSANLSGDAIKVQDQADEYKKQLKKMKEYILSHSNIPQKDLMRKRNNDWTIDAEYCIENGVCDKIIETIEDVI